MAYGGPGDRVRLSKPCGSSARDLPAGARHASIETITMGGLKMLRVPAEDRLHPRLLTQRHPRREERACVVGLRTSRGRAGVPQRAFLQRATTR